MSVKARRRRKQSRQNLIVYLIGGAVILLLALLAYNYLNKGTGGNTPAMQWPAPPAMTIDVNRRYTAEVETEKGAFVIELLPQAAPTTVNSFVFLARAGYYDGVTFHRVLPGFVAQAGDPTGSGSGGPGYQIPNEDAGLLFDGPGVVAMANSGRDRNGSQFFVTYAAQPGLDGGFTIFGHVTSGMEVVEALTARDPSKAPNAPPGDKIVTIRISEP
jgi:cyclophilin family peptidyl-prolyl cis-trans isomerase